MVWLRELFTQKLINRVLDKKSQSPLDIETLKQSGSSLDIETQEKKCQSRLDIETKKKSLGLVSIVRLRRKKVSVSSRH